MSRILGIDFGTRRIGLALSDPTGTLAFPLPLLENTGPQKVTAALQELIRARDVQTVVIGLPRNMDGSYGPAAQKVREFIAQIQPHLSQKILTQDERLSTIQATRDLSQMGLNQRKLRKRIDSSSASLILQQFLDLARSHP